VNTWLIHRGFSVSVSDMLLTGTAQASMAASTDTAFTAISRTRHLINVRCIEMNRVVVGEVNVLPSRLCICCRCCAQNGTILTQPGRSALDTFESVVNAALNNLTSELAQTAAASLQAENSLLAMIASGSKGSVINVSQIAGCVGQQNVDGKVR
jgi:RNA polymerase Rpb1, domain 4